MGKRPKQTGDTTGNRPKQTGDTMGNRPKQTGDTMGKRPRAQPRNPAQWCPPFVPVTRPSSAPAWSESLPKTAWPAPRKSHVAQREYWGHQSTPRPPPPRKPRPAKNLQPSPDSRHQSGIISICGNGARSALMYFAPPTALHGKTLIASPPACHAVTTSVGVNAPGVITFE